MPSSATESEVPSSKRDPDTEALQELIKRLRPGDNINCQTTQWDDASVTVTKVAEEDGYYMVYTEGSRGGEYLFMSEKPGGWGNHPVPEVFWVNPEPDEGNNPYEVVTRGALLSLSITVEREL